MGVPYIEDGFISSILPSHPFKMANAKDKS